MNNLPTAISSNMPSFRVSGRIPMQAAQQLYTISEEPDVMNKEKLIIYQLFPRLLTNTCDNCVPGGTLEQNGSGKMKDIDMRVLRSIRDLGVNCVWYTGVIEHATKSAFPGIPADNKYVVKGEAGSPYAIKDYYDVSPEIAVDVPARMKEFTELVKRTHEAGMKVLIDFVPNHTARVYHSDCAPTGIHDFGAADDSTLFFSPRNNYYYLTNQQFSPSFPVGDYVEFPAKATGNDAFTAFPGEYDWYETVKLNYGYDPGNGQRAFDPVPDTWIKMLAILRFWAAKDIDGFRCDMVFMVPLEFWHWVIPQVKKDYPGIIFIGEIYDVGQYRPFLDFGHFDYLYDKVNLYDTLVDIQTHNHSAARLTDAWQTVDGIAPRLLNFLENHDEVRFGSKAYAGDPSLVLPSLVVSSMINTGPFMLYFGQELGESATDNEGFAGNNNRTSIFDYWSYDTLRRWYNGGKPGISRLNQKEKWLRALYSRILHLCNSEKAISRGQFFDLMYVNLKNPDLSPHRVFTFIRHYEGETLLIAVNFADTRARLKINIPDEAYSCLNLKEGKYDAVDLLTGIKCRKALLRGHRFETSVDAYGAVIWKLDTSAMCEETGSDGSGT